ncbi:hypothetical protein SAMN03159332_6404 [Paenibacillus sp. 276b]|nr:hypothetical protein SAMN03159332_6404 [Paenibacillus sp. 276b]
MLGLGPAIGYIVIGSALYRFRKRLGLVPHADGEWIGFSFYWGGWFALLWSILSWVLEFPAPLSWLGIVAAIYWCSFRGLKVANQLIKSN